MGTTTARGRRWCSFTGWASISPCGTLWWSPLVSTAGSCATTSSVMAKRRTSRAPVRWTTSWISWSMCSTILNSNPPTLPALSIGGLIAMGFAARHPTRIRRLAALNTVFDRTVEELSGVQERLRLAHHAGLVAIADLAIERWFTPDWQAEHESRVAAVRKSLLFTDREGYLKAYRMFVDGDPLMPQAAEAVTAPTLAMTGELDSGSTPEMSVAIAAAVANGRLRILSDLHHLPPGRGSRRICRSADRLSRRRLAGLPANMIGPARAQRFGVSVDAENVAVHEASGVSAQESDRSSNIGRVDERAHRYLVLVAVANRILVQTGGRRLGRNHMVHSSAGHRSGRNAVHPDPEPTELHRPASCETFNGPLRGRVRRSIGVRKVAPPSMRY